MAQVDKPFINSIEHRRISTTLKAELFPVIDLSAINSNHHDAIASLAAEIGCACEEWGFFQVINHGIPSRTREEIEQAARLFFSQPAEEKKKVLRDEANPMGFYDTEHTKNVRDWKRVFDFTTEIPTVIPTWIDPDDFELREDDVGGLEVSWKTDGEWIQVKPTPGAFIINVGDVIQVWSNDKYESVEHRVMVSPERERFSIPFFFNPTHTAVIAPMEELMSKQNPVRYRAYNWGKFHTTRNLSNFKKLGVENIQIYHFRI